jgi:hypothetical protein
MSATQEFRDHPSFKATKAQLADREWRLDHLNWVKDKDTGRPVRFLRNFVQRKFSAELWFRDVIVKARQLGFSTDIAIKMLDDCLFNSNTVAAIVDYKLTDAVKKLDKLRFSYERMPLPIRESIRLVKDNEAEMKFSNGSVISVGTSYRGDTPQVLHISEYGKISTDNPTLANEIKTGAIQAVSMNGKIYVESTAHGIGGEFYELVERAQNAKKEGRKLTRLDFKLHFFGWHMDPSYKIQSNLVLITQEMMQYYEELKSKGITLSADQLAWYAKKYEELGPDDMKSENPSLIEECFFNSLQGAFFKKELARARLDRRIGQPLPYDPTRVVNTFGDIGVDDEQAIWFHQSDGVRHRFIDFASSSGEGLDHYVRVLKEKQSTRGFIYGKHFGPHDLNVQDWSAPHAQTRVEVAKGLGIKFTVVPRVQEKGEAIEAARRFIATSYFCSQYCSEGVKALDNYRKKWNEKLAIFTGEPVHDWASHPADALMTGAMGWAPDAAAKTRAPKDDRGSAWSA